MHVGPYLGLGEPFNITRVMFEMPALVLDIGASTEIEVCIQFHVRFGLFLFCRSPGSSVG